jgi:hypothetical protein
VNQSKGVRLEVADGFYLSPIVRADKAAYLEHFADPEIAKNLLAIPFPYTEATQTGGSTAASSPPTPQ